MAIPGGQNSELLYNVIAPMMADAELPSRVMQPQASSTSSGNLSVELILPLKIVRNSLTRR